MTDLDRAIAAALEASGKAIIAEQKQDSEAVREALLECFHTQRNLLAALDAARGEAVATVQTITSLVGETRKCIIGPAEVIDSLPVGTAVYAAPPAALAANRDAVDAAVWRALDRHNCNGSDDRLRVELIEAVFSVIAAERKGE